jgi:pimeloyl-ACP methyl ester carboxylesterase
MLIRRLAALVLAMTLAALAVPAAAAPPAIDTALFDGPKKLAKLPNGETLAYVEDGQAGAPLVILVHGYTDNGRDWAPLVPYLRQTFHLVIVDLRGHGQSSKPECCYTRQDFAYDIKLLMDQLGAKDADLVGHSLGSIVVQTLAEYWPERTRRVVLISSTGGRPPGEAAGGFDFVTPILALKDPIDPDSPFMRAWWSSPTPVDEAFLTRQREDSARIPAAVWRAVIFQGLTGMELQSTLPLLRARAMLIWGDKDPIIGEADRASLTKALPAATVKLYPGLGHNPFWEEPEMVGRDITSFLSAPN